ncbi:hypothetical protein SAMN05421545_1875 [Pontibacter lucknowensis]|uniref:Uncharacterized protein n=1 Tax=Pontibacter lucknowensis TaxID=1077936 RepID=A0A1N6X1H8_9BACT|nr:hypothetical protein SAMN05421545_1875 [Pontibacter lucknowensis]
MSIIYVGLKEVKPAPENWSGLHFKYSDLITCRQINLQTKTNGKTSS